LVRNGDLYGRKQGMKNEEILHEVTFKGSQFKICVAKGALMA